MEELQTPEGVLLVQEPRESPVRQFAAKWILAWEELQQRVRQEPGPYILGALALGYILQIIPFRSLLVLLIRLCLMLVSPALFLLGAFKLAEYLRKIKYSGISSQSCDLDKTFESSPPKLPGPVTPNFFSPMS